MSSYALVWQKVGFSPGVSNITSVYNWHHVFARYMQNMHLSELDFPPRSSGRWGLQWQSSRDDSEET